MNTSTDLKRHSSKRFHLLQLSALTLALLLVMGLWMRNEIMASSYRKNHDLNLQLWQKQHDQEINFSLTAEDDAIVIRKSGGGAHMAVN